MIILFILSENSFIANFPRGSLLGRKLKIENPKSLRGSGESYENVGNQGKGQRSWHNSWKNEKG
jgi:hypothetical protein